MANYFVESPDGADLSAIEDIVNTNDQIMVTGHLIGTRSVLNLWKRTMGQKEWTRLLKEENVLTGRDQIRPEMLWGTLMTFLKTPEGETFMEGANNWLSFLALQAKVQHMIDQPKK